MVVQSLVNGTNGQYRVEPLPLAGKRRIFAATRVSDKARVVVKRPRAGYPLAEEVAALRHEFAVLSRLHGAPVIEAQDFIEDPIAGLVLAVAPGRSLDTIIAQGLPDVARFVSYAAAMAQALSAIHARGFTHRDVKPDHFFIDDDTGQARLVDFGLATHLVR
jgi:serine/threonine protein kinase